MPAENSQRNLSTIVHAAHGAGSRPNLASVLRRPKKCEYSNQFGS